MFEIRWHSRAGQGAVTGAKGLAEVVSTTGKHVQAFAFYGSAKRGAAMTAYNRVDDKQIINHEKFMSPDYILVIDPALTYTADIRLNEKDDTIYIFVPESSQVHKTAGKIFDRNNDGDFEITNNTELVTALYFRKQTTYSENMIFPYATIDDLRRDLIDRVRLMVKSEAGGNHPWVAMTDKDLLNSARLYQKDLRTGKEGYTLAAILLFGKDETILSALPHHRTDAILRRKNLDRYDDRDDIRTNLIESYDRLLAFVKKHLPDPFYLEDRKWGQVNNA